MGEQAVTNAYNRIITAVNNGNFYISDRLRENHARNFGSKTDKSYILPQFNIDLIVNELVKFPEAILLRSTEEDQNLRYVFEGTFSEIVGVTKEDQTTKKRIKSNRIHLVIGHEAKDPLKLHAFSLIVLHPGQGIYVSIH